jgi:hypothetical protein
MIFRSFTIGLVVLTGMYSASCNSGSGSQHISGSADSTASASGLTPKEARDIAKEAFIYGFPVVDNYRIQHSFFVATDNTEYKAPYNVLYNTQRVATPADKAMQTPNSDTPYGNLGLDLRTEPIVLTVPVLEKSRYFTIQLIDAYTHNFDYIGSRTTGNDGGNFLIAGPDWKGETPKGIKKVFRCETQFAYALYRTQLFNPADLENVKKVQAGYTVQTLSAFLGQPAPAAAASIDFIKPLGAEEQKSSLEFFNILNFQLQFCPTHPSEKELMERFAKLGIVAGKKIDTASWSPDIRAAILQGIADAWVEFAFTKEKVDRKELTSGEVFGTREFLQNNYMYRFVGDLLGIYGNSREEAQYPIYFTDEEGKPLNASEHTYTLHFAPGKLPPVNGFWSATMYELPSMLLTANPLNRYLINSPMLPKLKKDADGGITLHIQNASPGKDKESNWLPAPKGPFYVVLRVYWPKEEILNGSWKVPPIMRSK